MTKSGIIQRLLDEKHITVEEAMVLMRAEREYTTTPQTPTFPDPWNPQVWYSPSTTIKTDNNE